VAVLGKQVKTEVLGSREVAAMALLRPLQELPLLALAAVAVLGKT
jgi:hypothetical protein